jgi:hypothetical protein
VIQHRVELREASADLVARKAPRSDLQRFFIGDAAEPFVARWCFLD